MADSPERIGNTGIIELTGKIMVVTIVLLLSIVVFVFCFHLYAKYFLYRRRGEIPSPAPHPHRRRRRFDFSTGHPEPSSVSRRGLDPSLLKALPAVVFDPKELNYGSESMECAVCLSEVSDGERIRLLPGCSHGFHLDCIDMWFESHSTCPLCRNPIKKPGDELPPDSAVAQTRATQNLADGNSFPAEPPNFPTNVLIYGDDTQITTFSPPVENNNNNNNIVLEPSSSSISPSPLMATNTSPPDGRSIADLPLPPNEEDRQKSSMPMRLRSLKRLLSSNTRRVTPSSSRILDIEQGGL